MPAHYGIIGYPLSHSFSKIYFTEKFSKEHFSATYDTFPTKTIEEFPALLQSHPDLKGLSVTIPHKKAVMQYLDVVDDAALQIGAVNSIAIKHGVKTGYNTDVIGFENSLKPLLQPQHTQALILGTGGAALAVAWVLKKLGIPFKFVSRNPSENAITYSDLTDEIINTHKLIINATPLGMSPNVAACPPIPYNAIANQHLLYDLIYNPEKTLFLQKGAAQGATIKNGYEMLILQAEASWKLWNS